MEVDKKLFMWRKCRIREGRVQTGEVSSDGRGKQKLDDGDFIYRGQRLLKGFKLKKGRRSIYILENGLEAT